MTQEQYRVKIKSMIISALSIEYDKSQVLAATEYEKKSAQILKDLLKDENLMEQIAENIELTSYEAARADQKIDTPEVAIKYLSLIDVRNLCYTCYENLKNNNLNENKMSR